MNYLIKLFTAAVIVSAINFTVRASTATEPAEDVANGWIAISPIIAKASYESGIDVKLLAAMGAIESSFRPLAKNKYSSARGVYQFTKRTWRVTLKSYGHIYGLNANADIHDPYANAVMAAEYIKENINVLQHKLQRAPTYAEIYTAHLVSPLRAAFVATLPEDTILAKVYPKLARVNRPLFYADDRPLTVAEFRALMEHKVSSALHVYGKLANVALIKYQDGQIALTEVAATDSFDGFQTCIKPTDESNLPIGVHFISYEISSELERCPMDSTRKSNFQLLYIPSRQEELED